ncbi:MAG TPA: ABC transporter substrate-binding protein [Gaiellaceae bacterium]
MTRARRLAAIGVLTICVAAAIASMAAAPSKATARAGTATQSLTSLTGCKASKGTLTYGIAGAGITALDPNTIAFAGQEPLQTLLYDGLTEYNSKMQVVPDLATSWTSSPDLTVWKFKLRQGVRYATGRNFTSTDARANILRVLDPTVASQAQGDLKDIRSVRTNGKWGLIIRLGHPSALLPTALINVKMSDTTNVAALNTTGNGTGPYMVGSFSPGQTLTVVPNPHYWGGTACLAQIDFIREPDTTSMVTDFKAGKLGMVWQVPPADIPAAKTNGSTFLTPSGVSGAHVWEVDTTSPPFNNVLARQALSYAIDRKAMIGAAFFGLGTPSYGNEVISANSLFYDKSLTPYTFNLTKAKQLFAEAGVAPGTTFTYWALAGRRDEWITMAQILQQDLQKIGFNLTIVRSDVSTWLSKFYPAGKSYPGYIIANYFSLPPDPSYAFSQVRFGSCECNWKDPTFEALAEKAIGTPDVAARTKLYYKMEAIESQQSPVMVIAHQTNIVAVQKGITGAWEDAQGNVHLEGARFAS